MGKADNLEMKSGKLNFLEACEPLQASNGTALRLISL